MFVTVVAVLCRLSAASSGSCVEEIVTDSNMTPEISMMQCAVGAQAPLASIRSTTPTGASSATNACRATTRSRATPKRPRKTTDLRKRPGAALSLRLAAPDPLRQRVV